MIGRLSEFLPKRVSTLRQKLPFPEPVAKGETMGVLIDDDFPELIRGLLMSESFAKELENRINQLACESDPTNFHCR